MAKTFVSLVLFFSMLIVEVPGGFAQESYYRGLEEIVSSFGKLPPEVLTKLKSSLLPK